jgi:hypothetical protein
MERRCGHYGYRQQPAIRYIHRDCHQQWMLGYCQCFSDGIYRSHREHQLYRYYLRTQ